MFAGGLTIVIAPAGMVKGIPSESTFVFEGRPDPDPEGLAEPVMRAGPGVDPGAAADGEALTGGTVIGEVGCGGADIALEEGRGLELLKWETSSLKSLRLGRDYVCDGRTVFNDFNVCCPLVRSSRLGVAWVERNCTHSCVGRRSPKKKVHRFDSEALQT